MNSFLSLIFVTFATFSAGAGESSKATILDVRTNEEYAQGHAKSAVNLDVTKPDFDDQLAKLDKKQKYFVYCQAGGRSSSAVERMKKLGFTQVIDLKTVDNAIERFGTESASVKSDKN